MRDRRNITGFARARRAPSVEDNVRIAIIAAVAVAGIGAVAAAPQSQTAPAAQGTKPMTQAAEPEHIKVQHILIGFTGSVPGKPVKRTTEEARALAQELLKRARAGEDFAALVKQYTDDAFPGIYGLSNRGVPPRQGEYPRTQMVPAFGDTGFPLQVGEVGLAEHDPQKSPYGWHIVKRIE